MHFSTIWLLLTRDQRNDALLALAAQAPVLLALDILVHSFDKLWRRRIVREQRNGAYDFSHDCIREVAYAQLCTAPPAAPQDCAGA